MRHGSAVVAVLALVITTAGCVGFGPGTRTTATGPSGTTTVPDSSGTTPAPPTQSESPTPLPPPSGTINVSEGPKEPPERPPTLNASSVREFVTRYEYRIAYNSLWVDENTTMRLACRADDVTERRWGYEVVVTCTGSSETNGLNADWFTQSYRYRVSETALERTQIEPRDPVS